MSSGEAPAGPVEPMPITSLVCHLRDRRVPRGRGQHAQGACNGLQGLAFPWHQTPHSSSLPLSASPLGQLIRLLPKRLVVGVGDGGHACDAAAAHEPRTRAERRRWAGRRRGTSPPPSSPSSVSTHTQEASAATRWRTLHTYTHLACRTRSPSRPPEWRRSPGTRRRKSPAAEGESRKQTWADDGPPLWPRQPARRWRRSTELPAPLRLLAEKGTHALKSSLVRGVSLKRCTYFCGTAGAEQGVQGKRRAL